MSNQENSSEKKPELTKEQCIEILEARILAAHQYGGSSSPERLEQISSGIQTLANLKGWNHGQGGKN